MGILQARVLEWVAISFSRGSSWSRNQTRVPCFAGRFFTSWATAEALRWQRCVQVRSDLLQQPRGGAQSPWESSPPSLRLLLSESTSCAGDRSLWSSCSWCSAFSWAQLRSCAGQAPSSIAAPRHRAHKHVCKVFQTTCGQSKKILGRKQFYLWAGMKTVLATASLKMHRLPRQEQFLSLTASLEWLQTPPSQQPLGILPSSFSHSPITGPRLLVETLQSGL